MLYNVGENKKNFTKTICGYIYSSDIVFYILTFFQLVEVTSSHVKIKISSIQFNSICKLLHDIHIRIYIINK